MSLVWLEELIHLLVIFFEFVGGLLIIYGGIVATAKVLPLEIAKNLIHTTGSGLNLQER